MAAGVPIVFALVYLAMLLGEPPGLALVPAILWLWLRGLW